MKRLSTELAAVAAMSLLELQQKWAELDNGGCPALPASLLRRLIAQQLQEKRYGALPRLVLRELEREAAGEPVVQTLRKAVPPSTGTRLIREWNGRTIAVEVRDTDFMWEGRPYRSLSEIAKAVTGAHWSGPRFFGLSRHG